MKLTFAALVGGAAALVPPARKAAPVVAPVAKPVAAAVAAAVAAPLPAMAADLSAGDLILPVGGLTLLLTGVIAGILGYTTIGDGPANPAQKK
eukprot:CAMPEP_0119267326 /NCGR_PEP_ID=MMETSP1329-20130426/5520_1 /TAXON_ID=114041 /ORGANISM="Genus nov. species nov., Strain RCC1024" /LENGTH=92 /DNA_ID=CAMNT_0007267247 /DNA_START=46 /DNA_END=324 /DNA_ORIENTATION=+